MTANNKSFKLPVECGVDFICFLDIKYYVRCPEGRTRVTIYT